MKSYKLMIFILMSMVSQNIYSHDFIGYDKNRHAIYYKILNSRPKITKNNVRDTQYLLECQKCKKQFWKNTSFLKCKAICPYCSGGMIMHNARGHRKERLYERYASIIRRIR